jgi:tetratricopeptide (TPR) repeat protein
MVNQSRVPLPTTAETVVDASELQGKQPHNEAEGEASAFAWHNEISGVAAGPVVQARSIAGDVLIGTASPPPLSPLSLLPPLPANFCGRTEELAIMRRLASECDAACQLAVVVIVGPGGIGKTSLAARWLYSFRARYPGGVLYANLGGDQAQPARPGEILDSFLRFQGTAAGDIPAAEREQAALFRSMTAGRGMIIFLDNAGTAAQVRPLLPGPGPQPGAAALPESHRPGRHPATSQSLPNLVLVTSRSRMTGLAIDGATHVELPPLDEPAATELFGRMVGRDRVAAEAAASREVVQLCGGFPLAVCVSGARLAAHPRWPVSRIAGEMAEEKARLSALSLPGDLSVRAAFDASYQVLRPEVALAYRTFALIPGPDFSADLAAAALNDEEHGQELLDTLVDASLLTETADCRYYMHDLTRLHAREQFEADSSDEQREVIARSAGWYLRQAVAADFTVLPGRWRLGPLYERPEGTRAAHLDPGEALHWLESSLPGLLAAVHAAHDAGLHQEAWQLCEALWGVLLFGKHYAAWLESHQVGLSSAQACGDGRAEAQMHIQLGAAHRSLGNLEEANQHFSQALDLFREAAHPLGEASALDQLGLVRLRRDCYDDAISDFAKARAIHQAHGRPRGIALMTLNIGQTLAAAGRRDEAAGYFHTADEQFTAIGEPYHRARTLTALGDVLIGSGQPSAAEEPLRHALAITEKLGAAYDRAHVHVRIADLATALDDRARAVRHLEQALALFDAVNAPQADSVRTRLAAPIRT